MTKEEHKAIKARWEAVSGIYRDRGISICHQDEEFIAHARQDIPILLTAIDEAEREMSAMKIRHYWVEPDYRNIVHNVETDRDRWKARAEALELFIRSGKEIGCCSCKKYKTNLPICDECQRKWPCNWQFDEEKFIES